MSAMAKCPACEHEITTPFALNEDKWRWFVCPNCAARLERKKPRLVVPMTGFFLALISLGTLGHTYAIVAEVLMVVIIVIIIAELMRPQLQLRAPLPKPEDELKINNSAE